MPLLEILKRRELLKEHIILKIDVEGGEWPGFKHFPIEQLDYIDMIIMEVHLMNNRWGHLDIFKNLMEKFVSVNLHMNNYACFRYYSKQLLNKGTPSWAFEVTLVNKNLIKVKSDDKSYKVH